MRKNKLKDNYDILECLDLIFMQIVQSFSALAIFDLHGISNTNMYNYF